MLLESVLSSSNCTLGLSNTMWRGLTVPQIRQQNRTTLSKECDSFSWNMQFRFQLINECKVLCTFVTKVLHLWWWWKPPSCSIFANIHSSFQWGAMMGSSGSQTANPKCLPPYIGPPISFHCPTKQSFGLGIHNINWIIGASWCEQILASFHWLASLARGWLLQPCSHRSLAETF